MLATEKHSRDLCISFFGVIGAKVTLFSDQSATGEEDSCHPSHLQIENEREM